MKAIEIVRKEGLSIPVRALITFMETELRKYE